MTVNPTCLGTLAGMVLLALFAGGAAAGTLPDGFEESEIAAGFTGATAMEVAPDGRVFLCEQTGALRVIKGGVLLPAPFVTVAVDSSWERGLLGIAFDPHFEANGYVYLMYVAPTPYPHHRISRFTARGDAAVPDSEVVLFEGDDQEKLGGGVKNGHQGGALHFGKDGKLYAALGDQTAGAPAQDLDTLLGKLLRLNPDGTIPVDNPFFRQTSGKYRAIWARGLRNPFTFAVQPGTGRLFINDVGGANEEINEGAAGANYGWPTADHGPTRDPRFRGPLHWYKESSITGGAFYNPPRPQFPAAYVGRYFFGDFKAGWIKTLDPDRPADVRDFLTGLGNFSVVDLKVAPDGGLYYLRRRAWVKDRDFRTNTGVLLKITWTGKDRPPVVRDGPLDQAVPAGAAAWFRVRASGTGLAYRWRRDGRDIPGATTPTLVLAATAADDGGHFRCVVTNRFGTAVSRAATLRVEPDEEAANARPGGMLIRPRPGRYTGPITVQLAFPAGGAVLRYTLDGSRPGERSPAYTRPFPLARSATVTILPFVEGKSPGEPVTAAFAIEGTKPYGVPWREPCTDVRVPPLPEDLPPTLSGTGLFASLAELTPRPGLIPYDVNVPLWSDGAAKRRWIAPGRGPISFAPTGEWRFPAGTIFVKHFELATDDRQPPTRRRLETRLLVVDGTGYGYGATYRWRPDGREADLLTDGLREDIAIQTARGRRTQTWYYPGRADCLACHTPAAGLVLGVKTRQLNRPFTYPANGVTDNQVRAWNYLGLFRPALDERHIDALERLAPLDDAHASLEERARSYLDANCAHCHRPGNVLRAAFDARFDTPLRPGLVGAPTVSDSLGVHEPRLAAPGDPGRSMIYQRMRRGDAFRMPPLAVSVADEQALAVVERWIRSLPAARGTDRPPGTR
jgi:uncharacterized repeat protein (TIGR03806 family)